MTSTTRCGGVKLAQFNALEVYKLVAVRVDASPMKAFDLDQASISGNSYILEAIVQELNLDKLKLGLNFLVPVSGDQLTVQRLRSLKNCRIYDDADIINKLQMIYDAHGGSEGTRNPVSLRRLSGVLGRTKIFTTTGNMDFYAANILLRHVTDALVIVAIMAHIRVNSFEQMQEQMATDNWHDIIVAVVKKWIPPTIIHFNRKEKAPSERDGLLENAVLLLQHGLIYRTLGEAVTQGVSGRVVKQMQMLTVMFHSGRQSNYATECLEWSMVNPSGREGKWIEMDRFNEQLVNYIKAIYNPRGTPASDRFQYEVIARLIILFG
ncbi:hypothetical protein K440DRAFT_635917 [Wilcoxina mikolae CBS 423.85]|nr:hypothetical protein K440DRAFT_635917 [Wilcoxina mikolae CBS 423.85]